MSLHAVTYITQISNGISIKQLVEASVRKFILSYLYTKENLVSQATLYTYTVNSLIEVKGLSVLNF